MRRRSAGRDSFVSHARKELLLPDYVPDGDSWPQRHSSVQSQGTLSHSTGLSSGKSHPHMKAAQLQIRQCNRKTLPCNNVTTLCLYQNYLGNLWHVKYCDTFLIFVIMGNSLAFAVVIIMCNNPVPLVLIINSNNSNNICCTDKARFTLLQFGALSHQNVQKYYVIWCLRFLKVVNARLLKRAIARNAWAQTALKCTGT